MYNWWNKLSLSGKTPYLTCCVFVTAVQPCCLLNIWEEWICSTKHSLKSASLLKLSLCATHTNNSIVTYVSQNLSLDEGSKSVFVLFGCSLTKYSTWCCTLQTLYNNTTWRILWLPLMYAPSLFILNYKV
jgi:hypothetical protein